MLERAVAAVEAPDVVFALSVDGTRRVRHGGTGPAPPGGRDRLRYELGSASKPFAGLLLARLVGTGRVGYHDGAAELLDPGRRHGGVERVTLTHLITHTSGLPALPADFYPQALPRWTTDPFSGYPAHRVVAAFLRARPRHRPGTRWHYSNFGASVLGHTLAAATGTAWEELLTAEVLAPLGLRDTALRPSGAAGTDAVGHRRDGTTQLPPLDVAGFAAAGAVRATPYDMLGFLEAHLRPDTTALGPALRAVRQPLLRRGWGRREVHTLTWFQHSTEHGPVYFHCGATSGQQAFLGFCPGTGAALAAACTRRFRKSDAFVPTAYGLLLDVAGSGPTA
ncbi:serine hydrolase domain-containing protein [Streptomyces sp. ICBB 8177]|uniref:serine hydrolase domain-containing protein n=1 Tax=Streptomyces sp. ICBB 8177 TaxID=563922 RepID=UPI001F540E49|nr:serine hydrolase domain-containing protein [Streptomyces sp. ICBB 8177]